MLSCLPVVTTSYPLCHGRATFRSKSQQDIYICVRSENYVGQFPSPTLGCVDTNESHNITNDEEVFIGNCNRHRNPTHYLNTLRHR